MVIILLDANEATQLMSAAKETNMTACETVAGIINKYFPAAHIMDKEKMAEGYKEAGAVNLAIANGDQEG